MGRVNTQSPPPAAAAAAPTTTMTHFTHPHELHPVSTHNNLQAICSGCRLQSSATMYACLPCNFTLHQSCAKLPRRITHPCHGGCNLSLHTSPPYEGGVFNCDACNRRGEGWSYHCAQCEYDLHVTCASKPMEIRHHAHASCALNLTFKNPYANAAGFSCDICRRVGSKQWLYRCNSCEFDVHLDCVAAAPTRHQPVLQHHHSLPAAAAAPMYQNNQLPHSASMGVSGLQANRPPAAGLGSNLMMAAMQGLVEGAFQGVGQTIVQEVMGGGGDGGADGGGGGGDGSTF